MPFPFHFFKTLNQTATEVFTCSSRTLQGGTEELFSKSSDGASSFVV